MLELAGYSYKVSDHPIPIHSHTPCTPLALQSTGLETHFKTGGLSYLTDLYGLGCDNVVEHEVSSLYTPCGHECPPVLGSITNKS